MALLRERGIIFDIQPDYLLVATPDKEFISIPTRTPAPRLGEEIEFIRPLSRQHPLTAWFPAAVAAAIIVFIMVAVGWVYGLGPAALAQPTYYLAIDINPSWELAVNHQGTVLALRPLNNDAARFADLPVGGMSVEEALRTLMFTATERGYFDDQENYVAFTVVEVPTARRHWTPKPLYLHDLVYAQLESVGKNAYVEVFHGSMEQRDFAINEGISLNRLLAEALLAPQKSPEKLAGLSMHELLAALQGRANRPGHDETLPVAEPQIDSWQPSAPAQAPEPENSTQPDTANQGNQAQNPGSPPASSDTTTGDEGAGPQPVAPTADPNTYIHLVLKSDTDAYPNRPSAWSGRQMRRLTNQRGWEVILEAGPSRVTRKDWVYVTVAVAPPQEFGDEPVIVYLGISADRGRMLAGGYQELGDTGAVGFRFFVNPTGLEGMYTVEAFVGSETTPYIHRTTSVMVAR